MSSSLSLRNVVSNQTQINTAGLTVNNTTLALGSSAGATKTNFSNGSYAATSWQAAQSGLNANKKIQMSATGQYQLDLTSPIPYLSSDSGSTWTALGTSNGLPTGSTAWLNGAISASGQYITLADSMGGFLYASSDYGATFNNTTPTASAASLYSWLKFNGNATDSQGNANGTVTGSVTYVTGVTPGSQAVNLANTAGGAATSGNYIRGPWANVPNFTVSGWFNPQTINGTFQVIYSSHSAAVEVFINNNNQIVGQFPTGNGSSFSTITTSFTAVVNTWYYFTLIYQTNGICYFYLNNTLIGTMTNAGGLGTFTSSGFYALGIYDHGITGYNAFNGYIDDFKLTNAAITYQPVPVIPPAVWLKFENNTTDSGSLAITPTVGGSVSYVTGAVGLSAVRLANTAGSSANNNIRMNFTPGTALTLSLWFNLQSAPPLDGNFTSLCRIGSSVDQGVAINISNTTAGGIYLSSVLYSSSGWVANMTDTSITLNTWYHLYMTIQSPGQCSTYLNGRQVGSITFGTFGATLNYVSIGTLYSGNTYAFNGFIDDFRLYNTAVPFSPMIPANYNAVTLSGSGQYQLASTQLGTVIQSADYGVTWTTNAAATGPQLTQTELALSHAGQYAVAARRKVVTPNTPGPWSQIGSTTAYTVSYNGITWISDSSSNTSGGLGVYVFEDQGNSGYVWTSGTNYSNSGTIYNNTYSTMVQGVGTVNGEYIQLSSSVPIVLSGFNFRGVGATQNMKTYYIVGSINGTTWYPIQYGSMTVNVASGSNVRCNTVISTNYTGIQSLRGSDSTIGSVTTTAYPYSTGSYSYFRWIVTTTWGATTAALDELYPQFVTSTISPQLTGLSTNTWAQAGVTYTASASSVYGGILPAYLAFNNNYTVSNGWASAVGTYNNTTGVVVPAGSTTVISTIGSVSGEWIQLQTSVPLSLQSYTFAFIDTPTRVPKIYYIVGSMDGSTWVPLHYAVFGSTSPFTTSYTTASSYITVNYTGSQIMTAGAAATMTTTSYPTSTGSYLYFRMVINSVFPTNDGLAQLGELYLNFSTPTLVSNNTLSTWSANLPQIATSTNVPDSTALSASGQYLLQTTKIQPYAWLPFDNSATDLMANTALTVTGSPAYTTDRLGNSTGAINLANTAGGTATKYVRGTYSGAPIFSASFWMNPQTLSGVQQQVFVISGGYFVVYIGVDNKLGYYIPTGGGLNATTIATTSYTLTTSTWYHVCVIFQTNNTCSMYVNGSLVGSAINSGGFGSVTTSLFSFGCNDNAVLNAFNGYIDDFRLFNTALNATHVAALYANQTALQCPSLSSSYLPSTGYTMPSTLAPSAAINASATSFNGQVMAVTTSAADVPLARLTLDNTAADSQGALTATTGAGTVTYSTTVKKVGTYSAFFNNTAGGANAPNRLNYTFPASFGTASVLTMGCWIYPTAIPSSNASSPLGIYDGNITSGPFLYINPSGQAAIAYYTTVITTGDSLVSSYVISINTWSHIMFTYQGGLLTLYVNGVSVANKLISGNLSLYGGGNMTNLIIGSASNAYGAYQGYVDDVRLYSQALNAAEIQSIYAFNNAANNVYYSTNYGVTWTPTTVPSTESLQGITLSSDGSYLTAISNTAAYTLNTNSSGYSLAVGNQAGQINQGKNAIAIGNQAGVRNQTENSIVINATGSTVNPTQQGFYVSPIAGFGSAAAPYINLLGYGTDQQVIQSGLRVYGSGIYGTSMGTTLHLSAEWGNLNIGGVLKGYVVPGVVSGLVLGGATSAGTLVPAMYCTDSGYVGIGTNNPGAPLHVHSLSATWTNMITCYMPNMTTNNGNLIILGKGPTERNNLSIQYCHIADGSTNNYGTLQMSGVGAILNWTAGGNVGIGLTNPQSALHVVGTCIANTFSAPGGNYLNITNGAGSGQISLQAGNIIFSNSYVGIGTGAPRSLLHLTAANNTGAPTSNGALQISCGGPGVNQDAIVTRAWNNGFNIISFENTAGQFRAAITGVNETSVAYNTSSDRRLKDNIHTIDDSLSIINKLQPVHFRWINDDEYDFGLIAQEVYKVLPFMRPNLSGYIKDCTCTRQNIVNGILCAHCQTMNDEPVDENGKPRYYGLDYGKFTPYLIGAVKELSVKNQKLSEENTLIKQQLEEVTTQLISVIIWAKTHGFSE